MLLSHYEILGGLGAGQYGQVYRARYLKTGDVVAIKELSLGAISTHRFIRELRAMSCSQHPNLVNLLGVEYGKSGRYLVLEYCDRGTLSELMAQEEPLSLGLKCHLILDILRGLQHLHHHGIFHCDLKPQNIFLSQGKRRIYARIGDLGSAMNRDALANLVTLEHNANPGSPAYMAPERFYGELSSTADLYSVGVMLYELLVGDRPFLGPVNDLTRGHLSETLQMPADLPFFFRSLIQKALQKLPQNRFQSADEMLKSCQMASLMLESGSTFDDSPLIS